MMTRFLPWLLQIHVFDKLDYCGTLKNLEAVISLKNFQVCRPARPYDSPGGLLAPV